MLANGVNEIGWDKFLAVYPIIGGDATAHSFNLIDPAEFQITWSGTLVHNSNGVTGDGATGYGNTGFVPSAEGVGAGSFSAGTYFSANPSAANAVFSGATDVGFNPILSLQVVDGTGVQIAYAYLDNDLSDVVQAVAAVPFRSMSATSTTSLKVYGNGIPLNSTANARSGGNPPFFLPLMASNNIGVIGNYCDGTCALSFIGNGLTDSEMLSAYSVIQQYQTILGRQV